MAKINIPSINEIDFSEVPDAGVIRRGVRELLGALSRLPDNRREAQIRWALENREAFTGDMIKTLEQTMAVGVSCDLSLAARKVVDIVLEAVRKQLKE